MLISERGSVRVWEGRTYVILAGILYHETQVDYQFLWRNTAEVNARGVNYTVIFYS